MAGVQSWPKCWLSGSCPRAQCQRWWTMNICHSVVSCLELKNLIKYDAGWYIFFRSNAELNSSFPCQLYRRRVPRQTFSLLLLKRQRTVPVSNKKKKRNKTTHRTKMPRSPRQTFFVLEKARKSVLREMSVRTFLA